MKDNFAQNNLPEPNAQPDYLFLDLPQFNHPENLNCVERLLDHHIANGKGSNICLKTFGETFCPSKYISLVIADSVVISFPEITPIFFIAELVSYFPISTLPAEHCVTLMIIRPFLMAFLISEINQSFVGAFPAP